MNPPHCDSFSMNHFNTIAAALTLVLTCATALVNADTGQPVTRVGKHCPVWLSHPWGLLRPTLWQHRRYTAGHPGSRSTIVWLQTFDGGDLALPES